MEFNHNVRPSDEELAKNYLDSKYFCYVESWLQVNYPALTPKMPNVDEWFDKMLLTFPGLPTSSDPETNIPQVEHEPLKMVEVDREKALTLLRQNEREIRRSASRQGAGDDEVMELFLGNIIEFIRDTQSCQSGAVATVGELVDAFTQIPDPVTGHFVERQLIESQLGDVDYDAIIGQQ